MSEVFELHDSQIKPTPTIASRYRADYIQGMIQENDHFMMVLNIDKVFSSNDLESISESKELDIKED